MIVRNQEHESTYFACCRFPSARVPSSFFSNNAKTLKCFASKFAICKMEIGFGFHFAHRILLDQSLENSHSSGKMMLCARTDALSQSDSVATSDISKQANIEKLEKHEKTIW